MDDIKQEFWGDLQADLAVENSAIYLANQSLSSLISTDGKKAHRPILSHAQVSTYSPYNDITFKQKRASKQTLEVDTFKYAADEIDITDRMQSPYGLDTHSLRSIREGLMNHVEQKFLSEIPNARHAIASSPFQLDPTNVLDVFREAGSKLGSFDVPVMTSMRAAVFGPQSVEILRQAKSQRESSLGDTVLSNGVVGPWHGWTVVQNNNLPWSAKLKIATNPTDGDTVVISGVTFTFKATPTLPGHVDIGSDAAGSRANLKAAVEGGAGAGTDYIDLSIEDDYILRRKRSVACTNAETMVFTGFGDIAVSETLTATADIWSDQQQQAVFMIRGAIDLVMQFMDLEMNKKEKGFATLVKGIVGLGTKVFADGAVAMVKVTIDASSFV